jgi:hypothetical protein
MPFKNWPTVKVVTAAVLTAAFAGPQNLVAQAPEHLITSSDLQKAAEGASHVRQQNLDTLRGLLSSPEAQKAMESAHMNPQEVLNAVAGLSDQEMAQLASRASKAQSEFAAGSLSDRDLIILLVVIAALILIIVAVK